MTPSDRALRAELDSLDRLRERCPRTRALLSDITRAEETAPDFARLRQLEDAGMLMEIRLQRGEEIPEETDKDLREYLGLVEVKA